MEKLQKLRTRLIDRIMLSDNAGLLRAIEEIFEATQSGEVVNLTSEQIEMLKMSELDIQQENIISEDDLLKQDDQWMK